MNKTEAPVDDALLNQLQELADDPPPMPEGLHAAWMQQVEEEAMKENRSSENRSSNPEIKVSHRRQWLRGLSIAAAAVFLIGGTLITRGNLRGQKQTVSSYSAPSSVERTYESAYSTNDYAMEEAADVYVDGDTVGLAMGSSKAANTAAETEKKIIRTVNLTVSTKEYQESYEKLISLCEEYGGWVAYANESTNSQNMHTASLTLRIPAEQLDAFLADADGTGTVTRKTISADDVTESYQDTQARLKTQQDKMTRLRELMLKAEDISDLLVIENEIADTQYWIDSYQASLNSTDRQVAYSSVDITLKEEAPAQAITNSDKTLGERLSAAITAGLEALLTFLGDMLVFLTAVLPFLAIIGLVIAVVAVIRHNRKKHQQSK